jgi:hypothetical protein
MIPGDNGFSEYGALVGWHDYINFISECIRRKLNISEILQLVKINNLRFVYPMNRNIFQPDGIPMYPIFHHSNCERSELTCVFDLGFFFATIIV